MKKDEKGGGKVPLYVLGINLDRMSAPVQMGVCVAGVLVLYLLYGYSQVNFSTTMGVGS